LEEFSMLNGVNERRRDGGQCRRHAARRQAHGTHGRWLVAAVVVAVAAAALGLPTVSGAAPSRNSGASDPSGTFGDLKDVCGPGDAAGATARGVTDDAIRITTLADPGNAFAPGLGQEFFDTADAFVKWCNDAGGILGRKITLSKRDSKGTDVAARTIDACQTDFMIVGGGSFLGGPGVQPRVDCGLGAIPAILPADVTTSAAPLQVTPFAVATDAVSVGAFRAIARAFPSAVKQFGVVGVNLPPLEATRDLVRRGAESAGFEVVSAQSVPLMVDNWRPYVQQLVEEDVQALLPAALSMVIEPFIQTMNDLGYRPKVMVLIPAEYLGSVADAARAIEFPPTYVSTSFWPVELAKRNPATAQAIKVIKSVKRDAKVDSNYLQALDAWLLWAVAAKACGSNLTVGCVIEQAGSHDSWTAGGLASPVNTDPTVLRPSECFAMLKVTRKGFVYDRKLTKPNKTIFNCDPKNVAQVRG
jgi:ABC-type branched-subunit amino acid transport system substrate-binding protein